MPQHLTDAIVKKLPPPVKGSKVTFDTDVKGFGCRVTAAGARAYVFNYRTKAGRDRQFTIGAVGNWRCTAAREEAKRHKQLVNTGGDPMGDVEALREAPDMSDLIDRFMAEHVIRKRPSTADDYRRMLELHVRPALAHLKVAAITFTDIDALHRRMTQNRGAYIANRTTAVLSKLFNLAIRWGMRTDNPARGVERNYEAKRKRYLSGDELSRLVAALAAHQDRQTADIIRLLLLTGCRRGEALSARWADLDPTAGVWTKPGSTTKQRIDHVTPLSAPARQLLSEIRDRQAGNHPRRPLGEYVFPAAGGASGHQTDLKKGWATICKAAGITGLRMHDLRHSYASQLASSGATLVQIGALLGHSNPSTTSRYAHLFDDVLRAATERVGAAVTAAGKNEPEPVPFPHRRGR